MLTLNRQVGETIKIGDDIEIMLTNIRGKQASISIKAPREILILRGELDSVREDSDAQPTKR